MKSEMGWRGRLMSLNFAADIVITRVQINNINDNEGFVDMNKPLKAIVLIIQFGGGLLGLNLIGRSLLTQRLTQTAATVHIAFIFVFLFGIFASMALVKKPKLGLWMSAVFQAMQIPILMGPATAYVMVSGACLNLYKHATGYGFNFLLGSRYYFSMHNSESWMLGINFLALVLFILLVREIRFDAAAAKIYEPQPNMNHPSQQFVQAQNHQTSGSPLRHILR